MWQVRVLKSAALQVTMHLEIPQDGTFLTGELITHFIAQLLMNL